MRKMMQIYLEGNVSYQMDRNTLEIYTLNGNFRGAASMGATWGFIIAFLVLPIIAWFIDPVRPIFDLHFLTQEINAVIIVITSFFYAVMGIFLPEIGMSRFVVKKVFKMTDAKYEAQFSEKYQLLTQTEDERKALLKKALWKKVYFVGIMIFVIIFLMPSMGRYFINDSNLLTYFLFSILSLILVAPTTCLTRLFFVLMKVARKEGVFEKENRRNKTKEERGEAIKKFFRENPASFLYIRILGTFLAMFLAVFLVFILEWLSTEIDTIPIILDIIVMLVVLVLFIGVPITAFFLSYCPNCKWALTMRIFLALGSRSRGYTHYCRKCEKKGIETKCY